MSTRVLTEEQAEQSSFIVKVYGWMTLALTVTGIVAKITALTPTLINLIFSSNITFYGLLSGELLLVFYISSSVEG